ncbi:MAG: T9SS type A sorting domain-containing protein [Calditrichae bacterium]|nr:T9SS type A sorting domain-containing protein [Calditrichia bacterium]
MFLRLFILLALVSLLSAQSPFVIGGDDRVVAEDFRVTTFATGLNFPVGMATLADSSVLVAVSNGTSYFGSTSGSLIQLIDTDDDGIADEQNILVDNVSVGGLSALFVIDNLIFTMGQGKPIVIYEFNPQANDSFQQIGKINLSYGNSGWLHPSSALTVRKTPGFENRYDLFFPIGSKENFEKTLPTVSLSSDFDFSASLNGDAIHMVTLEISDGNVSGIEHKQIATGLRSASGLAFHPVTGDLYFEDNGIDGLTDPNEPHSADEINFIAKDSIGGSIENFGFPDNFIAYRSGEFVGGEGIPPLVAFQPLPDPQTGSESEGPNEITFAPPLFPEGLNDGIFVGFHGKWSLSGVSNEENPLVYVDNSWDYFHFVDNDQDVGHMDGLLAFSNKLFISDISPDGNFNSSDANEGKIYLVEYTGPASALENGENKIAPVSAKLYNAYPNPFNPSTTIGFRIENTQNVTIEIFDIMGNKIVTLLDEIVSAGEHEIIWNTTLNKNNKISSGIYYYTMQAGNFRQTKQIILIK